MKKEIYLHIPEPCHEDWNAMTAVEQGRFCKSCAKQVVDFSAMSDREILKVLTKSTGNTCGRFTSDQLEKPLIHEVPSSLKPYKFFLSAFIPAFILAGSATAQPVKQGKVAVNQKPVIPSPPMMGAVAYVATSITGTITLQGGEIAIGASVKIKGTNTTTKSDKYGRFAIEYPYDKTKVVLQISYSGYKMKEVEVVRENIKPLNIKLSKLQEEVVVFSMGGVRIITREDLAQPVAVHGKVVNEINEPLAYATIKVSGTGNTIVADSLGHFTLPVNPLDTALQITTSYIGYEQIVTDVSVLKTMHDTLLVTMKNPMKLGEVVVTSYPERECALEGRVGGLVLVEKVTYADTIKRYVAKAFKNEMFTVFPNPARVASIVHITFKEHGTYNLQLFDNSGKLYFAKEIVVDAKQSSPIQLPAGMSSGAYYIKAVNAVTRKQFIDKILIQ